MIIRRARTPDFPALQAIEVQAGSMFAAIGMDEVAADPPFSLAELARFAADRLAWVATDDADWPVGYLVAMIVDGRAHIEQVSVRPSDGRRGTGRALIEEFAAWASDTGFGALTLTTFEHVPWNAPLYERLGFRRLEPEELTPTLARIRALEAEHGLDRWPRIAMIRPL